MTKVGKSDWERTFARTRGKGEMRRRTNALAREGVGIAVGAFWAG